MKHERARLIQALIEDIDSYWNESNYGVAIEGDHLAEDDYCVYLYSRDGHEFQTIKLAGLACSLEVIACDIHYTLTEYNKATHGEEIVHAIKIW